MGKLKQLAGHKTGIQQVVTGILYFWALHVTKRLTKRKELLLCRTSYYNAKQIEPLKTIVLGGF